MKKFQHVALGGTFDHLHDGHRALLDKAFAMGQIVTIGIMHDDYNHHKQLFSAIQQYDVRHKALQEYLKETGYFDRARFFVLTDIYGLTLVKNDIEALVVSTETIDNARKINTERSARMMPQLKIVLVQMVKGVDRKIIRSERIRYGIMDRHGNLYANSHKKSTILTVQEKMKEALRIPFGHVCTKTDLVVQKIRELNPTVTISVGDTITSTLVAAVFIPDIQIYDRVARRIKDTSVIVPVGNKAIVVKNKASTIAKPLVSAITKAIADFFESKSSQYIHVHGEEDMAALAAMLVAPLGGVVVYGHHGFGVIVVEVTEKLKEKAKGLMQQLV